LVEDELSGVIDEAIEQIRNLIGDRPISHAALSDQWERLVRRIECMALRMGSTSNSTGRSVQTRRSSGRTNETSGRNSASSSPRTSSAIAGPGVTPARPSTPTQRRRRLRGRTLPVHPGSSCVLRHSASAVGIAIRHGTVHGYRAAQGLIGSLAAAHPGERAAIARTTRASRERPDDKLDPSYFRISGRSCSPESRRFGHRKHRGLCSPVEGKPSNSVKSAANPSSGPAESAAATAGGGRDVP
jgi:hypothetical protein